VLGALAYYPKVQNLLFQADYFRDPALTNSSVSVSLEISYRNRALKTRKYAHPTKTIDNYPRFKQILVYLQLPGK
jgi:hypothetical protein